MVALHTPPRRVAPESLQLFELTADREVDQRLREISQEEKMLVACGRFNRKPKRCGAVSTSPRVVSLGGLARLIPPL